MNCARGFLLLLSEERKVSRGIMQFVSGREHWFLEGA